MRNRLPFWAGAFPAGRRGYLLEIRLLVAAAAFLLAALLPLRAGHPVLARLGIVGCTAALLAGAYYMIVLPGWRPGRRTLPPPWNHVAFGLLALALGGGCLLFVLP